MPTILCTLGTELFKYQLENISIAFLVSASFSNCREKVSNFVTVPFTSPQKPKQTREPISHRYIDESDRLRCVCKRVLKSTQKQLALSKTSRPTRSGTQNLPTTLQRNGRSNCHLATHLSSHWTACVSIVPSLGMCADSCAVHAELEATGSSTYIESDWSRHYNI